MHITDHHGGARARWRENGRQRSITFATEDLAEQFKSLTDLVGIESALAFVAGDESLARQAIGQGGATGAVTAPASTAVPTVRVAALGSGPTGVTLAMLWNRFMASRKNIEDGTADNYKSYFRIHIGPFFGGSDVGRIFRDRPLNPAFERPAAVYVSDFLEALLAKPRLYGSGKSIEGSHLSGKMIRNIVAHLNSVFEWALDTDDTLAIRNPCRGLSLASVTRREMLWLSDPAAYPSLRAELPPFWRALVDFLIGTGVRVGEAAGLQVRHLHLAGDRPFVMIVQALKWRNGHPRLGRPKTQSSVRRIFLSPRLVAVLSDVVAGKTANEFVFTEAEP
jgi:hypothetical protein